jgi:hypothetical protein
VKTVHGCRLAVVSRPSHATRIGEDYQMIGIALVGMRHSGKNAFRALGALPPREGADRELRSMIFPAFS